MASQQGAKQTSGSQEKPKIGHQRTCAIHNLVSSPNSKVFRAVQLGLHAYLETATEQNEKMYIRRKFSTEKRYRYGAGQHMRAMLYRPHSRG